MTATLVGEPDLAELIRSYHDVTERLKSSHELLQREVCRLREELHDKNRELERRERLAALGEMAAGVAHEIRNPLGGIGLYASLLERDLAALPEKRDIARRISAGVSNIEGIVEDVLAFAGGAPPRQRDCRLAEILDSALTQASPKALALSVEIDVDMRLTAVELHCDPGQIERALINLLINAVEAAGKNGRVWVRAGESRARQDMAAIVVEDNGPGIASGALQRIFHPFFTTKETGTGLGLAIVHRIAEAHGGLIAAGNRAGGGAAFVLQLPTATAQGKTMNGGMNWMAQICVVDDKEILRDSIRAALEREDHAVRVFTDPVEALVDIKRGTFDLIVSDLKMPRMDGLTLIREVRAAGCDAPIVMMTAYATIATAVEAMKAGAFDYIQKPFEAEALTVLVDRALEHARLRRENEALRTTVDDMRGGRDLVGQSAAMMRLGEQLNRVSASHATVLVTGESGTGKELVASYIHRHSSRADRPMLCLNCAALSANLLESELFGHERGAFTGAERTRKGRFELADGGTLLLDEISEMAVPLQAKLLRVLQENEFERVGSSDTRKANVRVIATTNRDLEDWIARKRFRHDLYYRLNVLPVQVPALRQRTEDIPELVHHFLQRAAGREGTQDIQVTPSAMQMLVEYSWPGNVRELENLCHRAATMCAGGMVTEELVESWLPRPSRPMDAFSALREGRMLEDMERQLIEKTLQRFNGHRAKSAKALGMGVRTLGVKLKQWREEAEAHERHLVGVGAEH